MPPLLDLYVGGKSRSATHRGVRDALDMVIAGKLDYRKTGGRGGEI